MVVVVVACAKDESDTAELARVFASCVFFHNLRSFASYIYIYYIILYYTLYSRTITFGALLAIYIYILYYIILYIIF